MNFCLLVFLDDLFSGPIDIWTGCVFLKGVTVIGKRNERNLREINSRSTLNRLQKSLISSQQTTYYLLKYHALRHVFTHCPMNL